MTVPAPRLLLVVAVSAMASLGTRAARADDPLRVTLRVDHEGLEPLSERLEGQLSELEISLSSNATAPMEETLPEQLAVADRLAGDVVVWLSHESDTFTVHVLERGARRLFSRSLDRGGLDSARLEQAALIVRTAVRAILEGTPIGEQEAEVLARERSSPPTRETEPSPPFDSVDEAVDQAVGEAASTPSAPRELRSSSESAPDGAPQIALALGWRGTLDGLSPAAAHEVHARVDVAFESIVVGLRVGGGIPLDLEGDAPGLRLSHHHAHVALALRLRPDALVHLDLGVLLGLTLTYRETRITPPSLEATEAAWLPTFTPGLEVRLHVVLVDVLALLIELGAHATVPSTELVVDGADGAPARALWVVQPWASLGLEVFF